MLSTKFLTWRIPSGLNACALLAFWFLLAMFNATANAALSDSIADGLQIGMSAVLGYRALGSWRWAWLLVAAPFAVSLASILLDSGAPITTHSPFLPAF